MAQNCEPVAVVDGKCWTPAMKNPPLADAVWRWWENVAFFAFGKMLVSINAWSERQRLPHDWRFASSVVGFPEDQQEAVGRSQPFDAGEPDPSIGSQHFLLVFERWLGRWVHSRLGYWQLPPIHQDWETFIGSHHGSTRWSQMVMFNHYSGLHIHHERRRTKHC